MTTFVFFLLCFVALGSTGQPGWIESVLALDLFPPGSFCNATVARLIETEWDSLNVTAKQAVKFCLYQHYWKPVSTGACDLLMREYNGFDWLSLDTATQDTLGECMDKRLYVEKFRVAMGEDWAWLPGDLLDNPLRKWLVAMELCRGVVVLVQYYADTQSPPERLLDSEYRAKWYALGMEAVFYEELRTVAEAAEYQKSVTMDAYFGRNNVQHRLAVRKIDVVFWTLVKKVTADMLNNELGLRSAVEKLVAALDDLQWTDVLPALVAHNK